MTIICFFGPDGSGKTTLAKGLVKKIETSNGKAKISWMRGTHTLSSLLAKLLSRIESFKGSNNPYYGITIPQNFIKFWQFIEFISMLPILFTRFLFPSLLGYIVIAERYLPDFIVWIVIITKDVNYLNSLMTKFMIALSLKAEVRIYITAELVELLQRRNDVNSQFIREQIWLYANLLRPLKAFKLDTTHKSPSESLDFVYNHWK